MRILALMVGLVAAAVPAAADVVFLKGGQRIDGEIADKSGNVEIKTDLATLLVPRSDVLRIVRSAEKLTAEAEALQKRARTLFEEASAIEKDPKAKNAKLKAAVELLQKAGEIYNEAVETYTDDKYAHLSKALVRLFQEMRIYRDQMVSELAGPVPPPAAEPPKPEAPPAPKPDPAPVPPKPEAPPAATPRPGPKKVDVPVLLAEAKKGAIEAQLALGDYYEERERNYAEAMKWYKAASAKLSPMGYYRQALLHLAGKGVRQDLAEGRKLLERAASTGHPLAQVQLGMLYFEGRGVPKSLLKADLWCEKAGRKLRQEAAAGNSEAWHALGWMNLEGLGLDAKGGKASDPSAEEAVACYRKAGDLDYVPALLRLGDLFLEVPKKRLEKNREEARKCYLRAAELGDAEAMACLGEMLCGHSPTYLRRGGDQKYEEAAAWFRKASDLGNPRGLFWLGNFHRHPSGGVTKDSAMAAKLYFQALPLASGDILARVLTELAFMHKEGDGLKKDANEAMKYFRMAAETGDAQTQFNLGALNEMEYRDPKEAVKWYASAAAQGNLYAQTNLGNCYHRGKGGVKINLDEAEKWYLMAAQQGADIAIKNLKTLQQEREAMKEKKKP